MKRWFTRKKVWKIWASCAFFHVNPHLLSSLFGLFLCSPRYSLFHCSFILLVQESSDESRIQEGWWQSRFFLFYNGACHSVDFLSLHQKNRTIKSLLLFPQLNERNSILLPFTKKHCWQMKPFTPGKNNCILLCCCTFVDHCLCLLSVFLLYVCLFKLLNCLCWRIPKKFINNMICDFC